MSDTPILIYASAAPRDWIVREFEVAGYQVLAASNGLVALDQATRLTPAMIVADSRLPGIDGVEVCRILKGMSSMPFTPIVLIEPSFADVDAHGRYSEADDVWIAPTTPLEVATRVRLLQLRLERLSALRGDRDRLFELAYHDHLTGLPNRRYLDAALADSLVDTRAHGLPMAILLFDVDRFKSINDRWGHPVGDRVLQEMAAVLRRSSRRRDVIGRYGGEEFLYLLPGHTLSEAVLQAERVRTELATHPFTAPDEEVCLTVSVGATEVQGDDTPHSLLSRADRLLYEAKRGGRNRIVSLRC
ncbi:diguanylate cyclase [bacterium]|nr:diguanylate cyclase [bacterium]